MTIPIERSWAIRNVRTFLVSLMCPKHTPRVPMAVRRRARQLLKHYPGLYDMKLARKLASDVFGTPKEGGDQNEKIGPLWNKDAKCICEI